MEHPNIKIIEGKFPVLISAPHAVPLLKEDKEGPYTKFEKRVSEIVEVLCDEIGVWGIFTQLETGESILENWDKKVYRVYKKFVREIVKENNISLVLDVHGSKHSRPFLIDYDFIFPQTHKHDQALEELLLKSFESFFLKEDVSKGFFRSVKGPGSKTLTYHVRRNLDIPAVQLELNEEVRQNEKHFANLILALSRVIKKYENITTGI
ncbi:MAG: hypothetical protein A3F94_02935 [Candidatus Spechtbacteria bacterium RIFCSPLOWO2_12_FULL_38_22]|uniref:N-formylglutamate amidohydrolase n=1 Tax=Candidatus Spechtbacteria bacterium RIFCSPLOWO2_12_FULL_38_22 TaxID=1802165 RepID=A0A1G2HID9_9BACT|nr:MAG: hypothetical protein A2728_02585 [Candidatus Spechtbacteria bacterium RIFCSPHIGHO2_01_FULL_38_11]OGZ60044.1 MAG: hypothetical protein A3E58_01725 [Candidatus Spechtbacteria bacterium RIFCSPHIGHO2_12_FULL_38_30]OGZ61087.1 MAG: hypothetical protein A3A00_03120 [Candidatus Spechtbacteria bacterium RIFCSPLOWO2_01_FULL_38_20]OGZ62255.1 MAG: hypothetical protein A3F94_02935 [Candidatus Spechtbacteria bacterium RIFCSPLOWO2_12_FULL_38_22]